MSCALESPAFDIATTVIVRCELRQRDGAVQSKSIQTGIFRCARNGLLREQRGTILAYMKTCTVIFDTALGFAGIAWNEAGVVRFQLPAAKAETTTRNLLRKVPEAEAAEPPPAIAQTVEAAKRYFAGEKIDFSDVTLDLEDQDDLFRAIYAAARRV